MSGDPSERVVTVNAMRDYTKTVLSLFVERMLSRTQARGHVYKYVMLDDVQFALDETITAIEIGREMNAQGQDGLKS